MLFHEPNEIKTDWLHTIILFALTNVQSLISTQQRLKNDLFHFKFNLSYYLYPIPGFTKTSKTMRCFHVRNIDLLMKYLSTQIGIKNSEFSGTKTGLPQGSVISAVLLIFMSDMFNGLNCKKFNFADDGNLLVIANTVPQLALNCQIIRVNW